MPKSNKLYLKTLSEVRAHLKASYHAGDRVPSHTALADMFGVSPSTIHQVIKALQDEKLVEARARSGVVIAGKKTSAKRPAGVAAQGRKKTLRVAGITHLSEAHLEDNIKNDPIYTLLVKEAERRGITLQWPIHQHRSKLTPERSRPNLLKVPWNRIDAAFVLEVFDEETLTNLQIRNRPVVAIDQDATTYGLHSVSFDNRAVGRTVARHLHGLGHRRFAMVREFNRLGFAGDPAIVDRCQGFEATLERLGDALIHRACPEVAVRGSMRMGIAKHTRDRIAKWRELPALERPTALFAANTYQLRKVIDLFASHNVHIPANLSLMTTSWDDHVSIAKPMSRNRAASRPTRPEDRLALTYVHLDLAAMVERAFDVIEMVAAGKPVTLGAESASGLGTGARLITAPASIRQGDSTRSVTPPRKSLPGVDYR